jgi:ATP-binding protein involved in chromosome partitioning
MSLDEKTVLDALRTVSYPGFSKDIVSLGVVRGVKISGGRVEIDLSLGAGHPTAGAPLEDQARAAVEGLEGVDEVRIRRLDVSAASPALRMAGPRPSVAAAGALDDGLIPGVRHTIAVASGKGGVGKSTVAVNLAVALATEGARVGLLDADVYGPSVPLMTGIDEPPQLTKERHIVPFERFGVRIMSLGFLVPRDSPVIWRGPMVMKALQQLLGDVTWGELDYLLVDMPPGTGDAQLTLSQKVRLAGAVIVTTPQDVALADARKGVAMFRKVDVPVLGIVENMSYFECPHCSGRSEIFGHGGGRAEAETLGVPCLGEIPLDPAIRAGGDDGEPLVSRDPDSPQAKALVQVAARLRTILEPPGDPDEAATTGGLFDRFRRSRNHPPK